MCGNCKSLCRNEIAKYPHALKIPEGPCADGPQILAPGLRLPELLAPGARFPDRLAWSMARARARARRARRAKQKKACCHYVGCIVYDGCSKFQDFTPWGVGKTQVSLTFCVAGGVASGASPPGQFFKKCARRAQKGESSSKGLRLRDARARVAQTPLYNSFVDMMWVLQHIREFANFRNPDFVPQGSAMFSDIFGFYIRIQDSIFVL